MRETRNPAVRRLLVVTYHFPPDGAIGGQRWAGLSKYLVRLGWEVHVITGSAGEPQHTPAGVNRHFRGRRRTLNDAYKAVAVRLRQVSKKPQEPIRGKPGRPRGPSPSTHVTAVRRILGNSLSLPDEGRGWVGRATSAARGLLRERKFDVVVTSGPPHSAHFAGLLATLGRDTAFWIDMRDPWSHTHQMGAPLDRVLRAERFLLRRLEGMVFPRAERIIVNTREFAAALKSGRPDLNVVCLPNGVDLEQVRLRDGNAVERGTLAYVGTLYAGRNLSGVCAAMRELLNDRPDAAAILKLNIAGSMEAPRRRQLENDIAAAGLSSIVNIHGLLSRAKALELLSRSHVALVLAQDQPMCVPAKLYESVGLGIPTLVIAEEGSAAAREARRIGALTVDGADVKGLRFVLDDMLAGRIPKAIESKLPISYEYLARQWDRLLRESVEVRSDRVKQPGVVSRGNS